VRRTDVAVSMRLTKAGTCCTYKDSMFYLQQFFGEVFFEN
jgi:hypothetical protein